MVRFYMAGSTGVGLYLGTTRRRHRGRLARRMLGRVLVWGANGEVADA